MIPKTNLCHTYTDWCIKGIQIKDPITTSGTLVRYDNISTNYARMFFLRTSAEKMMVFYVLPVCPVYN